MGYTFKPAARESIWTLVGLAGGTGSGKTYSALRLASGMAGNDRFALIDTENRRASMYADFFSFDTVDLAAPFTPMAYAEAINAAAKAGYKVIVVDSMSHEHAGEGGLLDMHDEILDKMAGADPKKREACNMTAWVKPKMAHKKLVSKLLQIPAHIILAFRAEPKIEMVKDQDGKWVIRPMQKLTGLDGWVPISEKNLPYELTCSFLLEAVAPGIPRPIKLQEQHKLFFALDRPITEESGRLLAEWARGGKTPERTDEATIDIRLALNEAATVEELRDLANEIKKLPRADQDSLRELYKQRLATLKKTA